MEFDKNSNFKGILNHNDKLLMLYKIAVVIYRKNAMHTSMFDDVRHAKSKFPDFLLKP